MKLLQVMRGLIDIEWRSRGQCRKEIRIGFIPGITDGEVVDDLELRRLAVNEERLCRPRRRQVLVGREIFPIIPEVLGRERMTIGPSVPLSEVEREFTPVLRNDLFKYIRNEVELSVIPDKPRITVDHHHSDILGSPHQHSQLPSVPADRHVGPAKVGDGWVFRKSLGDRRQASLANPFRKRWCLGKGFRV